MKKLFYFVAGGVTSAALVFIAPSQAVLADEYAVTETSEDTEEDTREDTEEDTREDTEEDTWEDTEEDTREDTEEDTREDTEEDTWEDTEEDTQEDTEDEALYNDVYDILVAQKEILPEGTPLTNDSFYYAWHGGCFPIGYGCVAFAFYLSDQAFGTNPARIHRDYDDIKVGDILRIDNNTHSVIVLEVNDDSVIVAEGNYESKVHWGRKISKSDIVDEYSYIMTRY
jgi:hypothetical protein